MARRNHFKMNGKGKKAQAATEYLHTYGWIFMSILMLAGVMVYYNTTRVQYFLPLECSFLSGLRCLDADVEETLLSFVVVNEFGFTLSNLTMNITGTCNSTANTTDGNPFGNAHVLLPNQQALYVLECQNITNMKLTEIVTFRYLNSETGEEHIKVGKLEYSPTA
ncbi:hypothetical protein KY359_05360 [Candidatus Woesearchaeota archaeon]|nr:hypothetical protein [Candidatus Woesearchaeota archaeon]